MTIYYRPYDITKAVLPKQKVAIACEIATREQFETDCHRLVPANTKVIHLTAKISLIFLPDGNRCDYDYVRTLLKRKGYGKTWVLHSVWLVEEEEEF